MASDVNKVNQYQEAILGSIEAYYNEKQKYNQYDITVEATVTSVEKKPEGIYLVKSANAEFEAYSSSGNYYKNDIVLVQIPNGDYKNPKYILGRKGGEAEDQIFSFKLPFDDFIGLRYLNENNNFSGSYWANYPTYSNDIRGQNDLREKLYGSPVWSWKNNGASTIGNTRLGIEADWQNYLGMYYPIRGTYGFRIIIKGVTASTQTSAQTEIEREEYFTNYDMYGNTYAYYTPYTQQKVIDISDFINVHSIDIYFYQDFNFADSSNKFIYYTEVDNTADAEGNPIIPENISFDNVNIYLGVSAEDIKDETTFLYSYGALNYTGKETKTYDDSTGVWVETINYSCDTTHDLHYVWVHYEKNGTFSVIDDLEDLIKQRGEDGLKETHIFWYRYLYDEDITEEELTWKDEHEDLKKDWQDSMENTSYECKMERYAGANWTFIPAWTDTFENTFIPRGNKSREKFKVVVHHDGTHTTSKELVFVNTIDVEAELAAGARNDAVVLKTFKLQKIKDAANQWTGNYKAVEDGSINAFHVYDENNHILINDDNEPFDQHYYYMQIQVRNEDTYKYEILTTIAEDGTETNTQVAWAFPYDFTMIKSSEEVDIYDAAYFGIDAINEPVRYQNFHNSTMKFTIHSTYNNRYLDNVVGAVIRRNNENYHIEKELMFGRAEGLGHDFLPVIEIVYPSGGTYLRTDNEFQIACVVYNKDGTPFENPQLLHFEWKEIGKQSEFYHYDKNGNLINGSYQVTSYPAVDTSDENYEQYIDQTYITKYKNYRGNLIRGWLKGNNAKPPIFEVTVTGAASYPLTVRKGFLVCNNHQYKQQSQIMVPSRVEFKSDGANPIFYNAAFEVLNSTTQADDEQATYQISYPEWKINNTNIFHLEKVLVKRTMIETLANNTVGENDRSYYKYSLAFNTEGNPQWSDSYLTPDTYTYIYYNIGDIYVAQAIAFDRNYYSSSLVNDWDGVSLTWDEENGAILSTMIAAGAKDSNNKFTGVMMGDWHAKGDESFDSVKTDNKQELHAGLYGYSKGAQVFALRTDGTGFIGAAGRGRIEFDGTEALISNPDRTCYINLNPVSLNLDKFDERNQSFSQNFIYCKVSKTTNNFSDIYNGIMGEQSWARPYFEGDNANYDFFVVDPNYGVLTTGGIVARYGALGNWMISNEGLYQKDAGKYMYIGYDSTDTETGEDQRYCIYAGTDFGALGDLESAPGINPYFYVTWDGTLFARKGLIANTWTVDDTSLQYKKSNKKLTNGEIFDKIYIGQGEANSAIILPEIEAKIYPDATTRPVANRWAISAGQFTDYTESSGKEDTDYINFGVTLSGELYSQLGTIGGWKISENQLYAANGQMIFDSENSQILIGVPISVNNGYAYPIMIDGATGLMSIAGTNHSDLTTGYLYLGNLSLEAISVDSEWQVPYTITQSNDAYHSINLEDASGSYDNSNSWSGGGSGSISATVAPLTYYDQITTTNTKKLTSSNTFNIVTRDSTGNYGVAIASGITDNGEKITAIYPTGCSENNSSLGISGHRWNMYANVLDATSISTSGVISAYNMYMNKERVATEPWVYNLLADVWNSLNSLSDAASGNADSIKGLGGALAAKAVTGMDVTAHDTSKSGSLTFGFDIKVTNKSGSTLASDNMSWDLTHCHSVTCIESGSNIVISIGPVTSSNLEVDSFDMAATAWFKAEKKKLLNEGYAAAVSRCGKSGDTVKFAGGSYDSPKSYSCTAEAKLEGHSYSKSSCYTSTVTAGGTTYRVLEEYTASSHSSGTLSVDWDVDIG